MGLLNIYGNISKLRPHITYRFNAEITPFGTNGRTNVDDIISFTIKTVSFPTFAISNETKRLLGNTQISFPTFKFGEREMSITFEETDDMRVFNTLATFYSSEPYFTESLPLINIKITQFDETMVTVIDQKTYVCRVKDFSFPTFNNNSLGTSLELKANFYVLYSVSDEKELTKIKKNDSGKIKHVENTGNLQSIFGKYMAAVDSSEEAEKLLTDKSYRTKVYNDKYNEIDTKRAALMKTIRSQLIDMHQSEMQKNPAYKKLVDSLMDGIEGRSSLKDLATTILSKENLITGFFNNEEIATISDKLNLASDNILQVALDQLSALNVEREQIREEEMKLAKVGTTALSNPVFFNTALTNTRDFKVTESETNAALAKIHSAGIYNISRENLEYVQKENAKRMQTAYDKFKKEMAKKGITVSINTYNDPGHQLGLGSTGGSHLLGSKVDLNFQDANKKKLIFDSMTESQLNEIIRTAEKSGLTVNWETSGGSTSTWGDFVLANAKTVNKEGKVYDVKTKSWTGERGIYNSTSKRRHRR